MSSSLLVNDCVKCQGNFFSCLPPNLTLPKKENSKNKVHKDQHLWKIWPEDSFMANQIVGRCPVNKSESEMKSVLHIYSYTIFNLWKGESVPGSISFYSIF